MSSSAVDIARRDNDFRKYVAATGSYFVSLALTKYLSLYEFQRRVLENPDRYDFDVWTSRPWFRPEFAGKEWKRWDEKFCIYTRWINEHGLAVGQGVPYVGPWLARQRLAHRKGTLDSCRVALLNVVGVIWEPNSGKTDTWMHRLEQLKEYGRNGSGVNVPRSEATGLGEWLASQRRLYRAGRLSQAKIDLLEGVGVEWLLLRRREQGSAERTPSA